MFQQKAFLLFAYLLVIAANLIWAFPPIAPWMNSVSKPVYSRAIGPPSGMDTIPVPFIQKSPFFPKFVDPKMMISKKTDMLSNLFSGLEPVSYNMANIKPIMPYGASESSADNPIEANLLFNKKRDTLQDGKQINVLDKNSMYKRGMFGPPKFNPMSPKFGSVTSFSTGMMPDYSSKESFSRRRRSIEPSSSTNDINPVFDDKPQVTNSYPLSYLQDPELGESTLVTKVDNSAMPMKYLSGMFSPLSSPIDPTVFISKKSAFLDALFKNIATSTPATTEVPVPKSTIVPSSFWVPSSVIPSPTEYTEKVSSFLDKLFNDIMLNATTEETDVNPGIKDDFTRSLKPDDTLPNRIARSSDDLSFIAAAKDTIVDMILSQLSDLKGDMMATLNDLIAYEKTATSAAITAKKPFKPIPGLWSKPVVDTTLPFQQKMAVLSQVFDMLTDLQRNITTAAKDMITTNTDAATKLESTKMPLVNSAADASSINTTLLDAVLRKLYAIDIVTPTSYPVYPIKGNSVMNQIMPKDPTSFLTSYPENAISAVKRQIDNNPLSYNNGNDDTDQHDRRQYTRGVKMQMHQRYQNLPAGSIESIQAGGGSTPEHQGGGIKLFEPNVYGNLNKWVDWMQYYKNEYQDHRHHHNHH